MAIDCFYLKKIILVPNNTWYSSLVEKYKYGYIYNNNIFESFLELLKKYRNMKIDRYDYANFKQDYDFSRSHIFKT